MPIRILIAEHHGLVRDGLRALLSCDPAFQVIGEAVDEEEMLCLTQQLHPDVVLIDISTSRVASLELVRQLLQLTVRERLLILTIHEDVSEARESLLAGAVGCIVKSATGRELVSAIHTICSGDIYVHPAMTRALLQDPSSTSITSPRASSLTAREGQVLSLIAQGYTNRQIACALSLSVRTVESHRANLIGKLGFSNRAELVRYATHHGLLNSTA